MNPATEWFRSRRGVWRGLPFRLLLAAAGTLALSCSEPEKETWQDEWRIRPEPDVPRVDPESGLVTETFSLPRRRALALLGRIESPSEASSEIDPFAAPVTTFDPGITVQGKLEKLGIPFPEKTSASYDSSGKKLTITQSAQHLELIRELLRTGSASDVSIAVRFEFYEVPALLALRLEQSASEHHEHTPEWEALQEVLHSGHARLLEVALLQGRNGERSKYEGGDQVHCFAGYGRGEEAPEAPPAPVFESRTIGTTIEIDPVADPEANLIDLNFHLAYHTAPAASVVADFPTRGAGTGTSPPLPVFHEKTLTTQLGLYSGDIRLLASFTPTGKQEYREKDVRHLVFLQAAIQSAFEEGRH